MTTSERRYLGRLSHSSSGTLDVIGVSEIVTFATDDVTVIRRTGGSFWARLDLSLDAGFTYTRSSGIAQLNLNADATHLKPASQYRLTASTTATRQHDAGVRDDRGSIEASFEVVHEFGGST